MPVTSQPEATGAQWLTRFDENQYVFDCLYCGNVFQPTPATGPLTGAGNQGRSAGLSVTCPRCGSTNTTGPRLAEVNEAVSIYPANHPTGIDIFTGDEHVGSIDSI